ncbi:hypothetical protein HWI79_2728 [Cryptosporidium felis]|nr:hypothetical protein HWI79_2728 [Cryptosporidium felis]
MVEVTIPVGKLRSRSSSSSSSSPSSWASVSPPLNLLPPGVSDGPRETGPLWTLLEESPRASEDEPAVLRRLLKSSMTVISFTEELADIPWEAPGGDSFSPGLESKEDGMSRCSKLVLVLTWRMPLESMFSTFQRMVCSGCLKWPTRSPRVAALTSLLEKPPSGRSEGLLSPFGLIANQLRMEFEPSSLSEVRNEVIDADLEKVQYDVGLHGAVFGSQIHQSNTVAAVAIEGPARMFVLEKRFELADFGLQDWSQRKSLVPNLQAYHIFCPVVSGKCEGCHEWGGRLCALGTLSEGIVVSTVGNRAVYVLQDYIAICQELLLVLASRPRAPESPPFQQIVAVPTSDRHLDHFVDGLIFPEPLFIDFPGLLIHESPLRCIAARFKTNPLPVPQNSGSQVEDVIV